MCFFQPACFGVSNLFELQIIEGQKLFLQLKKYMATHFYRPLVLFSTSLPSWSETNDLIISYSIRNESQTAKQNLLASEKTKILTT